jgi:hypothetical protein
LEATFGAGLEFSPSFRLDIENSRWVDGPVDPGLPEIESMRQHLGRLV